MSREGGVDEGIWRAGGTPGGSGVEGGSTPGVIAIGVVGVVDDAAGSGYSSGR